MDAKTTNNTNNERRIEEAVDAVFLPGKIHGCEDELYIIYFNPCACDGKGSWEIEIVDYDRILELYEEVDGNEEEFFALLPDWFQGEWYYCDADHEGFEEYSEIYWEADFIVGRDGNVHDEMMFLVNWAKGRVDPAQNDTKVRMVVEFKVNEKMLQEKNLSATDVVNSIEFLDHDSIDGFEIYPSVDGCDLCSDFFLSNPRVVSKEIVDESYTQELVDKVKDLIANAPNSAVRDADAILYDVIEEADFEITGIAECILRAWKKSSDKKAVEEMFYIFTNMHFEEFLEKCMAETTRTN